MLAFFVFGFFSQGYLRRYKPVLFAKWNLIVAAAIAGGCSLIIFILTFAVAGGSGKARDFPVSTRLLTCLTVHAIMPCFQVGCLLTC